jgi:ATP-dependent Lon protease
MGDGKDNDFIPLITAEDEEKMNREETPDELLILPLRNTVLFPGVVIPITVGRDKSIKLIQDANKGDKTIGAVSQKDESIEEPEFEDLNKIGTVATIIKTLKMPDGNTTVIIQGKKRFELEEMVHEDPYLKAKVKSHPDIKIQKSDSLEAMQQALMELSQKIIKLSPNIPSEANFAIQNIESLSFLVNFISSNMNASVKDKQKLLELTDLEERAKQVLKHLNKEIQMLELKTDIQSKVKTDIDKQQREYYLH